MSFNSQQISLLNLAILLSILLSQTVLTKAKSYSGVRGAEQEQQQQQEQQQNYRTNNQQQYNSKQQKHQQQEQHHTETSVSDEIDETKVMQQQHLQPQRQQHRLHKPHSIAKNNLIQQQQLRNTNTMPTKPIAAAATLTTMKILHTIQQHQHHGREYHKQQQQQQQHKHQPHHEIVAHEQHHSHQHYHHRHHHQEEHEHHQFQHPHLQTSNPIVAHNKMQMAHQHRKHQEQQHHQHQQEQQEYQKHHSATSHSHAHTPSPPPSDARAPRHTYSSYFSSTMPKRQINNNDDDHDYAEFSSPPLNASDHLERIYSSKDSAMDRDDIMHYDDYSYDEDDDFSKDYAVDDPRAYTQTDFGNYINRITTSNNHKHNGNDNEHDHQSARITRNSNRFADMAEHDPNYVNDEPYDDFDDNGVPGTLTVHKQNNYGTQEALKKSHENWTRRQRNKKAQENLALMRTVYNCNKPMPTVVRISDDATKRYSPHCILLHRCSESTGCCEYDALVCRPKDIELVDIFVYEYNGRDSPPVPTSVKAENHTACHCVLTNEKYDNTRDKRSPWRQRYERPNTPNFSSLPNRNHLRTANANEKDRNAAATNASCPTPNAMCPKHFNEDLKPACYCDCPKAGSENSPCHRLKNGEEGFAVEDRKCIANRSCKAPTCTYGDYNRESGRCPHPPRNYRQPNSQIIGFG